MVGGFFDFLIAFGGEGYHLPGARFHFIMDRAEEAEELDV